MFRLARAAVGIGRRPPPFGINSAARFTDCRLSGRALRVMTPGLVIDALGKSRVSVSFVAAHNALATIRVITPKFGSIQLL